AVASWVVVIQTSPTRGNRVATTGPDARKSAMALGGSRKKASLVKSRRGAMGSPELLVAPHQMVGSAAGARGPELPLPLPQREQGNGLPASSRARAGLALLLIGIGVPMAPAAIAETLQVGGERTARALLVIGDQALGLRDPAL